MVAPLIIASAASALAAGIKTYLTNSAANAEVDAKNLISRTNADAQNRVRQATNNFSAVKGAIARFTQGQNNQRILDAGGDALAVTFENFRRNDDQRVASNFEQTIRDAEEEGAQVSAAAASGLVGGVVDTINAATALRRSRANEETKRLGQFGSFDAGRRAASIMQQSVRGLDSSILIDGLDYNNNVPVTLAKAPMWSSVLFAGASAFAQSFVGGGGLSGGGGGVSSSISEQWNSATSGVRLGGEGNSGFSSKSSTPLFSLGTTESSSFSGARLGSASSSYRLGG